MIVMVLCFTIAPIEPGILLAFLLGAVFLVVGMVFFTLGVDLSMIPIGENVGTCMTQTKKLWLMIVLSFILGFIVTISEPEFASIGRTSTFCAEYDTCTVSCVWCRYISRDCIIENVIWHYTSTYACCTL